MPARARTTPERRRWRKPYRVPCSSRLVFLDARLSLAKGVAWRELGYGHHHVERLRFARDDLHGASLDGCFGVDQRKVMNSGTERDGSGERSGLDLLTVDPHFGPRRGEHAHEAWICRRQLERQDACGVFAARRRTLKKHGRSDDCSPKNGHTHEGPTQRVSLAPNWLGRRGFMGRRRDEPAVFERPQGPPVASEPAPGARQTLELVGERARGLKAVARELLDGAHHDSLERHGNVGGAPMQRDRRIPTNPMRSRAFVRPVATIERPDSTHELVQHDSKRENVASSIDAFAEDLLR